MTYVLCLKSQQGTSISIAYFMIIIRTVIIEVIMCQHFILLYDVYLRVVNVQC